MAARSSSILPGPRGHARPRRKGRGLPLALAGLAWMVAAAAAQLGAQSAGLLRLDIPIGLETGDLLAHDLDGDGKRELAVIELDHGQRDPLPSIAVFREREGAFRSIAGAAVPLPHGLATAGTGDFSFGPGLVLMLPGRVEVWPWRGGRFAREAAATLAVDSVFLHSGGELKPGLDWIVDLDGDGRHEIVLPQLDGLQVLQVTAAGELIRRAKLRARARSRLWLYLQRRQVSFQLPVVRFMEVDGRGWQDVVAYEDGLVQIYLLDGGQANGERVADVQFDLQPPKPFDPAEPWDPPLKLVHAGDINGDGTLDLVFVKVAPTDSAMKTNTRTLVYYGRGGPRAGQPLTFADTPDQVFASEGFSQPLLVDINGDQLLDLAMVNVEIGFWNAIKALIARSVSAETAFYLMLPGGRFPQQPNDVVDYSVTFSLGRFSHQPITAFGDLNGDGRADLLLSAEKTRLGIHWGMDGGFWPSNYDEAIDGNLPTRTRRVRVQDLDGDGRDDLIFLYDRNDIRQMPEVNKTVTVLLSRFPYPAGQRTAGAP